MNENQLNEIRQMVDDLSIKMDDVMRLLKNMELILNENILKSNIKYKIVRTHPEERCSSCEFLMELFTRIIEPTNRDYWVMTELFTRLHSGSDCCKIERVD